MTIASFISILCILKLLSQIVQGQDSQLTADIFGEDSSPDVNVSPVDPNTNPVLGLLD